MKGCSTQLIIREVQIKATVRYYLTSVRMTIKKNLQTLARMWRNQNPCILLVRMKTGAAIMENTTEIAPKIKNRDTI